MPFEVHRRLRTPSSERYLLRLEGGRDAYLDFHYADGGAVHGSLLIVGDATPPDAEVESILSAIDERLLPEVTRDSALLTFFVAVGKPLGDFGASAT